MWVEVWWGMEHAGTPPPPLCVALGGVGGDARTQPIRPPHTHLQRQHPGALDLRLHHHQPPRWHRGRQRRRGQQRRRRGGGRQPAAVAVPRVAHGAGVGGAHPGWHRHRAELQRVRPSLVPPPQARACCSKPSIQQHFASSALGLVEGFKPARARVSRLLACLLACLLVCAEGGRGGVERGAALCPPPPPHTPAPTRPTHPHLAAAAAAGRSRSPAWLWG